MIGKQLKVYLHPEDQAEVDSFVHGDLASVLLAQRSPSSAPLELESSSGAGTGPLICPASLVESLRPRHIAARDEWVIEVPENPVIEWWTSRLDQGELYPGRLYFVPGSSADKRFLEAADRLFKWARRATETVETQWGKERLGKMAATKLRSGEISLRMNPPGSRR